MGKYTYLKEKNGVKQSSRFLKLLLESEGLMSDYYSIRRKLLKSPEIEIGDLKISKVESIEK